MSKIIHVSFIRETSQGFIAIPAEYRNIGNYVGRAKDFEPVSVQKLVADYRLDYERTSYGDYTESYGVIKFKNTEPSKLDFAIGTKGDASPNTRSGMLGNDSRIIFEYKMEPRKLKKR